MKILTDLLHDDLFPSERLDRMRKKPSQVETIHFIRAYYRRIHRGRAVPYHWHRYASRILLNAAESVFVDYETFKGPLADVMGLTDKKMKSMRNDYICISVQQYLDRGYTQNRAFDRISQRLEKNNISLKPRSIQQKIWPRRDMEWIQTMASELPDADFIAFLSPYTRSKSPPTRKEPNPAT